MFLEFIYKELVQKLNFSSQILIVTYDLQDSFDYVEKNKNLFLKNKISVNSNIENNFKDKTFDYIIFNFLFSNLSNKENIEKELAVYRKYLNSSSSFFIFIEELITKEDINNFHPFSIIRNTFHYLPYFNIRKNVTMDSFYDVLLNNSIHVLDTNRVVSVETLPTFFQEFFIITCSNSL
jgi:hypothetical protein